MDLSIIFNETSITYISEFSIPLNVQFWLYLIFEVPSLICCIFVLYHFIVDSTLLHLPQNHSLIAMNITTFLCLVTHIPFELSVLRIGEIRPATPIFCLIGWLAEYGFCYMTYAYVLWASIERHILIFYEELLATKIKRLIFHYVPLCGITIYLIIFYIYAIFFIPCQNHYDYTLPFCGGPCYVLDSILGPWDSIVHGVATTFTIAIVSISLLVRLLIKHHRSHRTIQWHKHLQLTIQLLLISSIFIIFSLPFSIILLLHMAGFEYHHESIMLFCFKFLNAWTIFLLPFACLYSLPNLKQRIKKLLLVV